MLRLEKISLLYLLLQACYIIQPSWNNVEYYVMKHTQLLPKQIIVRLKFMTLPPANQHVLGTEMTKFGLGGIRADGGPSIILLFSEIHKNLFSRNFPNLEICEIYHRYSLIWKMNNSYMHQCTKVTLKTDLRVNKK